MRDVTTHVRFIVSGVTVLFRRLLDKRFTQNLIVHWERGVGGSQVTIKLIVIEL